MKKILLISLLAVSCERHEHGKDGKPGKDGVTTTVTTTVIQEVPGVTMVQLCPGTPSYGSFYEFAQCVDNKLYGTYWDGRNAWTFELSPGNYQSTATGLQCSFTVKPNCEITH